MEYLREGVRFQAYGQRDPLVEYKREGYILFQKLLDKIKTDIVNTIFKVSVMAQNMPRPDTDSGQQNIHSAQKPFIHDKVGRNDPCPCGSGKKYKKCCGK